MSAPPLWFAWQLLVLVYLVAREHWYLALPLVGLLAANLTLAAQTRNKKAGANNRAGRRAPPKNLR